MEQLISKELKSEYPFKHHYHKLEDGLKLHYVDEGGKGQRAVLMVHGNPTWSFLYRNVIKAIAPTSRMIALDHIGCGLSDKPQRYTYTLEKHIDNLESLVKYTLEKEAKFDLIVHDWGGAIGTGLATRMPERIRKLVIINTAAFTSTRIPKRINFCKIPFLGEKFIRHFNGFAYPATFMAVKRPLSKLVKKGFLLPYNNYQNRIATARFVKDIPMSKKHPTWSILKNIEKNLHKIKAEKLILWGGKDFCFNDSFYKKWLEVYPEAKSFYYEKSGHYLLEDSPEAITQIEDFLNS